jgi:hypothetical protein
MPHLSATKRRLRVTLRTSQTLPDAALAAVVASSSGELLTVFCERTTGLEPAPSPWQSVQGDAAEQRNRVFPQAR